ncbi:hypothetical protein [Methylobacterium sp. E-045]|uniref:hypothetical protein n=1 Tax=Methylobacterium sp. E-045 TaxID=2836575 RepID=UPI001FBB1A0E|nr:hypothetical protein [Methylobacterium sp. E-045]MCJ2128305.1 hypothetical protein [Methylobacterium sp. E-045]
MKKDRTRGDKAESKPPSKLGAEKLTPEEQKRRFEQLARELECDESEENFDAALRVIAKQKPRIPKEEVEEG